VTSRIETPTLSLGAVVGGIRPEAKAWSDAVRALTLRVSEARIGAQSPLNLNVVFHIPGEFLQPKFTGLRTGRFSARERTLMVQVALPQESPPPDATEVLIALLRDAVETAEAFAESKKLNQGTLKGLRTILEKL
jgi:hypothetical protein